MMPLAQSKSANLVQVVLVAALLRLAVTRSQDPPRLHVRTPAPTHPNPDGAAKTTYSWL